MVCSVSIVLPTYNRASTLPETLLALGQQSFPPEQFEVIVVDDGSTDGTDDVVAALELPYVKHFLKQENEGAAAARNLGVSHATGDLLLFLDADVIAHHDLLKEHRRSHQSHAQALVAGRRMPWPAARTSLLSQIVDLDSNVKASSGKISFQEAFTANLSIKKTDFHRLGGFDEEFPASGCEDVELAYRATKLGLEIVYNPGAIGYHNHPATLPQVCQQTEHYQASTALLLKKHPELCGQIDHLRDKEPISWGNDSPVLVTRKTARRLLALPPVLLTMQVLVVLLERWMPSPRLLRFLYWKILGSYQLIGFREGIRRYGWQ